MKCFVTGSAGFIGANLVHELARAGHTVRALIRPGSNLRGLEGASYEPVMGDVLERATLETGLRGCEWCFHVAASYHLWLRDYSPMYSTNVQGTRNVIQAAAVAGCRRIVYTSTVGCIGLPRERNGSVTPTDESTPVSGAQMSNHYKLSKWQAEEVARDLAAKGLPVDHRQSERSGRATRRETNSHGAGHRGFSQPPDARLLGHRIELGPRPRCGHRPYPRRRTRTRW